MTTEDYFRELLHIASPSKQEEKMRERLEEHFIGLGYEERKDEYGNVLFYLTDEGEKIMFSGHMDTVPNAVVPHPVDDGIWWRTDGTTALGADDKAAVAAMMKAAEEKTDKFIWLFCISEETGLYGSSVIKKEFFDGFDIKFSYILDANGHVGKIYSSAPGKKRLTIIFKGKTAHAGFEIEKGINAIELAAKFITSIETGRLKDGSTLNIGSLIAEGVSNIVPPKATLVLESRSLDNARLEEIISNAEKTAREINPDCGIIREDLYGAYCHPDDSPLVKFALEKSGEKETFMTLGGSDANNLCTLGYPALVLGIGYEGAHSINECIKKEDLDNIRKLIMRFA